MIEGAIRDISIYDVGLYVYIFVLKNILHIMIIAMIIAKAVHMF